MVCAMTKKEADIYKCATMILRDECPPDNRCYLCMMDEAEDLDCARCWDEYMMGIAAGTISFPNMRKGAPA